MRRLTMLAAAAAMTIIGFSHANAQSGKAPGLECGPPYKYTATTQLKVQGMACADKEQWIIRHHETNLTFPDRATAEKYFDATKADIKWEKESRQYEINAANDRTTAAEKATKDALAKLAAAEKKLTDVGTAMTAMQKRLEGELKAANDKAKTIEGQLALVQASLKAGPTTATKVVTPPKATVPVVTDTKAPPSDGATVDTTGTPAAKPPGV